MIILTNNPKIQTAPEQVTCLCCVFPQQGLADRAATISSVASHCAGGEAAPQSLETAAECSGSEMLVT